MSPCFTCHPEIKVIKFLCWVSLFPLFESGNAFIFELFPRAELNVFCGIATETVYTVGSYPIGKPCGDKACNCIGSAVFCLFSIESTLFCPLCLKELRDTYLICRFCTEIGQTCKTLCQVAAAIFFISGQA